MPIVDTGADMAVPTRERQCCNIPSTLIGLLACTGASVVPKRGSLHFLALTQDLRPGLPYGAPTGLGTDGGISGRTATTHCGRVPASFAGLSPADAIPTEGAPSFRVLCERVGGTEFKFRTLKCKTYRSEVPTLAKNARMGHPQSG
jgi:hypothetical protein